MKNQFYRPSGCSAEIESGWASSRRVIGWLLCSVTRHADTGKKWMLAILIGSLSLRSYFVRELLATLFFFTVFYAVLVAVLLSYALLDHVICRGIDRAESLGRVIHGFAKHRNALPAHVTIPRHDRALNSS